MSTMMQMIRELKQRPIENIVMNVITFNKRNKEEKNSEQQLTNNPTNQQTECNRDLNKAKISSEQFGWKTIKGSRRRRMKPATNGNQTFERRVPKTSAVLIKTESNGPKMATKTTFYGSNKNRSQTDWN